MCRDTALYITSLLSVSFITSPVALLVCFLSFLLRIAKFLLHSWQIHNQSAAAGRLSFLFPICVHHFPHPVLVPCQIHNLPLPSQACMVAFLLVQSLYIAHYHFSSLGFVPCQPEIERGCNNAKTGGDWGIRSY